MSQGDHENIITENIADIIENMDDVSDNQR